MIATEKCTWSHFEQGWLYVCNLIVLSAICGWKVFFDGFECVFWMYFMIPPACYGLGPDEVCNLCTQQVS